MRDFISNYFNVIVYIIVGIISILVFFLMAKIKWGKTKNIFEDSLSNLELKLKVAKSGLFSFDKIAYKLKSKGVYYLTNDRLTPGMYIVIKFMTMMFVFIVTFEFNKLFTIVITIIAFFLPDILIDLSNKNDNEKMMTDIKNMFDIIKIHTRAGVFLTQSLTECYLVVENKRLKTELLKMINALITTNDVNSAVSDFNSSFDNSYINVLCIIIVQAQESGFSLQMIQDLSKQIADMQTAVNVKLKTSLERKIQFAEIGMFIGLLVIIIYLLFTSFETSLFTI